MNGILITPLRKAGQRPEISEALTTAFKKEGHNLSTEVLEAVGSIGEEATETDIIEYYRNIQNEIRRTDFIVCDISIPSSGMGFIVAQAINDHRPVLALVQSDKVHAPLSVMAKDTKFLSLYKFESVADVSHIVQSFVRKIKRMVDYRFILLLHSNLEKYLDWASHNRYQPKSVLIRKAIESRIKEDIQYQRFLEEEKKYLLD